MAPEEAEPSNFADWQQEACEVIFSLRDHEAALRVLDTAFSTALLLRQGDQQLGGRVRALTPEVMRRLIEDEGQTQLCGSSSFSGIMPSPDKDTQLEFAVYMMPHGQTALEAFRTAQDLDSQLIFANSRVTCPPADFLRSVREFQGMLAVTPNNAHGIAHLVYQHFGDEAIDLAFALSIYSDMHDRADAFAVYATLPGTALAGAEKAKKKEILERRFGDRKLDATEEAQVLSIALGDEFLGRLRESAAEGAGPASTQSILAKLKELIETKSSLRRKLLRACMSLPMVPDKLLADLFVRLGWPTFMTTESLTERDFWMTVKADIDMINRDPAMLARYSAKPDYRAKVAAMEAYFAAHPDEPADDDKPEKVMDLVDCDRHRSELRREQRRMNSVTVRHKQMEIIHAVCREAFKLKFVRRDEGEAKTFEQGFPANAAETGNLSCFSGPWLIAMLLLNAGFEYEDLSYCHINEAANGYIGGHGGLVVKVAGNQLVFIDFGLHTVAPIRVELLGGGNRERTDELIEFFRNKGIRSVHTQTDRMMAAIYQIHPDMQIMDLTSGFGSGHMLHVGIKLLNEGDIEAAEYALQMALSFHKEDPDALYYLGLLEYRTGSYDESKAYCKECVGVFPRYLAAHFLLGQMADAEGDQDEAVARYKIVVETEGHVFGDDVFRGIAKDRLVALGGSFDEQTDEE